MKYFMWAIFIFGIGISATANEDGYTLGTEPWSSETFKICPQPANDNLRAVIFEPEIDEWTYTLTAFPTAKLVATKDGVIEITDKEEKIRPAYFLKEQKIGYLNHLDQWVTQNGSSISSFNQLKSVSGERLEPAIKPYHEKRVYKANIKLEHAAAMEKLHYEPPCTAFSVRYYDKLESNLQYEFGNNNPFECDVETGLKRSEKFNYTETLHRSVVAYVHGTNYFIKFPDGEAKSFSWTGIEQLYSADGKMICDWGEITAYAGYELIHELE